MKFQDENNFVHGVLFTQKFEHEVIHLKYRKEMVGEGAE